MCPLLYRLVENVVGTIGRAEPSGGGTGLTTSSSSSSS
jgi:hypothetical protein